MKNREPEQILTAYLCETLGDSEPFAWLNLFPLPLVVFLSLFFFTSGEDELLSASYKQKGKEITNNI